MSAKRHAYRCVALQVPVGGEEVATEVAVVGSPQEFDFEIRSVFATWHPLHRYCTLCVSRHIASIHRRINWQHNSYACTCYWLLNHLTSVKLEVYAHRIVAHLQ